MTHPTEIDSPVCRNSVASMQAKLQRSGRTEVLMLAAQRDLTVEIRAKCQVSVGIVGKSSGKARLTHTHIVYIYIYMCVYVYLTIIYYIHIYMCVYIYTYIMHMYVYIYIYMQHTCVSVNIYMCMCISVLMLFSFFMGTRVCKHAVYTVTAG